VRLFDLSQSPSGSVLALFEKPGQSTTASFRRLIPSASSGTRHPQAISASAQTSIAARGSHHDLRSLPCSAVCLLLQIATWSTSRAAIIFWTSFAVVPVEILFDAIETELERRGVEP
jgi:hypothetical protein